MPRAYTEVKVKKFETTLKNLPKLNMSSQYVSVEHVVNNVGYGTDYIDNHFVVARVEAIESGLDKISDLAYRGEAALFGEHDTACKGYPWAVEEYISTITRKRSLLVKPECDGAIDYTIDGGWPEYLAYQERESAISISALRPPICFAVNLKRIERSVMDGTWPAAKFATNIPKGQHCTLLLAPGYQPSQARLWPVYDAAVKALRAYDEEAFVEGRACVWSSRYRAGDDWCPPIGLAEGGFFHDYIRNNLKATLELKPKNESARGVTRAPRADTRGEPEKSASRAPARNILPRGAAPQEGDVEESAARVEEGGEEDQEFYECGDESDTEAANRAPQPSGRHGGRNPTFTCGADYPHGQDPENKALKELGYSGKAREELYKLVRQGTLELSSIQPAKGAGNRAKKEEYPVPQGTALRFPVYELTRKLNNLSQRGENDRLQAALAQPRDEWVRLPTKVTTEIGMIKNFLKKNPEGSLQDLINVLSKMARTENKFMKLLSSIYGLAEIDVSAGTYSERRTADPYDSEDEKW
jgi:hypothetical protein